MAGGETSAEPTSRDREPPRGDAVRSTDRLKAFTDAVVAIAMTLLILPLLERVPEAAADDLTTIQFLHDNLGRLLTFLLSFVIIASFWLSHHRLYDHLAVPSPMLTRLNVAWMLTIVWLPVPTAMVGALPTDRLQVLLYIGTMLLTCIVALATHLMVARQPALWEPDNPPHPETLRLSVVVTGLFAVALVAGLAIPGFGYYGLIVLVLAAPARRWLAARAARSRRP